VRARHPVSQARLAAMLPAALGTPRPLPPEMLAARSTVDATLRELLAVPDGALRDKAAAGPPSVV
jgi:hypothetical protein